MDFLVEYLILFYFCSQFYSSHICKTRHCFYFRVLDKKTEITIKK